MARSSKGRSAGAGAEVFSTGRIMHRRAGTAAARRSAWPLSEQPLPRASVRFHALALLQRAPACSRMAPPPRRLPRRLAIPTFSLYGEPAAPPLEMLHIEPLPRLDASPWRALPAIAVGHAAPVAHERVLHGWRQGAGERVLPQRARRWVCRCATALARGPARTARAARFIAAHAGGERIAARACVVASGGFESNIDWLREAWGTQRPRRMQPAEQLPDPRHTLQPGCAAEGPAGARARTASATRRRRTWWPSTPVRRCTTAASARVWTACQPGHHGQPRGPALLRRGRGLLAEALRHLGPARGLAAGAGGAFDHRREGGRAVSCRRCSRVHGPTRCRTWPRQLGLPEAAFLQTVARLQRRLPRRQLRPCRARRLPHRRA